MQEDMLLFLQVCPQNNLFLHQSVKVKKSWRLYEIRSSNIHHM